jgi:hypothetical protein
MPWSHVGECRYISTHLTWTLEGHQRLASVAGLTHGGRAPSTHWIGSWLGPRTGLDAYRGEKSLDPAMN